MTVIVVIIMVLFSIKGDELERIPALDFGLEKDLQRITEKNLDKIFGLEFVTSEFQLNDLRMDTLAFDKETKSFVIIEYKKGSNFSVIDQGYAYLALLLNNKADFILEYNESRDVFLKKDDVDWSQSRVMFIAPQFTKYQRQAIEFKDLPIELWEATLYKNNTILFNHLKAPSSSESITRISKSEVVKKVSEEVKVLTEEDHRKHASDEVLELYDDLRERILRLQGTEVKPTKYYIAFKSDTNFVDVSLQKKQLKIWLNIRKGHLNDPKGIGRDVSNIGHWGNGDYEIILKPGDDLDYIMTLIKQSYKLNSYRSG